MTYTAFYLLAYCTFDLASKIHLRLYLTNSELFVFNPHFFRLLSLVCHFGSMNLFFYIVTYLVETVDIFHFTGVSSLVFM